MASVPILKAPAFRMPPPCHDRPLFVWVSIGRVHEEQVEITWYIGNEPLTTMATRTSYAIYPE
jgi:hypothetical protein